MRHILPGLFSAFFIFVLASCGTKDKKAPAVDVTPVKDSIVKEPAKTSEPIATAADTTLSVAERSSIAKLDKWVRSFRNFKIDSFRFSQKTYFPDIDYPEVPDAGFFDLYNPSLSYSSDSSRFIDLYSAGLMLERKGKKLIATADVDNAVNLFEQDSKTWKRIASFGPSAWIEEVIWMSPTTFILVGVGPSNDIEDPVAFLLLGDAKERTFRWFDSKATRPQSSKYDASGMKKLKIDEWE